MEYKNAKKDFMSKVATLDDELVTLKQYKEDLLANVSKLQEDCENNSAKLAMTIQEKDGLILTVSGLRDELNTKCGSNVRLATSSFKLPTVDLRSSFTCIRVANSSFFCVNSVFILATVDSSSSDLCVNPSSNLIRLQSKLAESKDVVEKELEKLSTTVHILSNEMMNERQNIIVKDDIIVKLKSEIGNEKSKMSSLTKENSDSTYHSNLTHLISVHHFPASAQQALQ
jgi:predicted  nucleic acid-binding Zn-ribbon protein